MSEQAKLPERLEIVRGTSVVPPSLRPADKGPQVAMTMFPGVYDCNAVAARMKLAWNNHDALVRALEGCLEAVNPPGKAGISMHEWNGRLKVATTTARAALDGIPK
jgi:hypothetical protein